jgi:hypothetical protein
LIVACLLHSDSARAVDPHDRQSVIAFYETAYLGSNGVASGWSGDAAACEAGTISDACREAVLRRIAYFREMAGLPGTLSLVPEWNARCQEAALMMSSNATLSHSPSASWLCYSADGDDAAGKSNLALGYSTFSNAVTGWILDEGLPAVGHRRWVLYPPLAQTGLGAVGSSPKAYAMWVIGGSGPRPASPEWVAWPPSGYVPYTLVPRLWSFSIPEADFHQTTVTLTRDGAPVEATLHPVTDSYGDNTLVWAPSWLPEGAPATDVRYGVRLDNVRVAGEARSFEYTVTVLDPLQVVPAASASWGELKARYR